MQKAFSGPLELRRRVGTIDAAELAAMDPGDLETAFRERPALHRFPGNMAKRTQALCARGSRGLRRRRGAHLERRRRRTGPRAAVAGAARHRRDEGQSVAGHPAQALRAAARWLRRGAARRIPRWGTSTQPRPWPTTRSRSAPTRPSSRPRARTSEPEALARNGPTWWPHRHGCDRVSDWASIRARRGVQSGHGGTRIEWSISATGRSGRVRAPRPPRGHGRCCRRRMDRAG